MNPKLLISAVCVWPAEAFKDTAKASAAVTFSPMMDARGVDALRGRLVEIHQASCMLQATADADGGRDFTPDELDAYNGYQAEFSKTEKELERRERLDAQAQTLARSQGARTAGGIQPQNNLRTGEDDRGSYVDGTSVHASMTAKGKGGFSHFGQFAASVRSACLPGRGGAIDPRLTVQNAAASPIGSESIGEDGGFLVPPDFRTEIMQKVQDEDQLLSRTDMLTATSNAIVVPVDETTPWETSAGVQAYWEAEMQALAGSKPKFQNASYRLNKLTALVNVTNELLEDAGALDGYLRRKAPQKINFKINRAIVAGTGVGQPQGIIGSPAAVGVAAEGGQTADTIVFANITKMWSRLYSPCWSRSVWLANQDTLPQLLGMGFPTSATAVPVFIPPGGLADSPYGRLMGRPIIFTEACETIGDKGDIILADLSQYMTALKAGGIRLDTSMHLYFDYDEMAFRFIIRVAGAPWWSAPITPRASSTSLSCFVTLAAR
jgi:HK97 family phage major capsid protein